MNTCENCTNWTHHEAEWLDCGICAIMLGNKITFIGQPGIDRVETDADFSCAAFERKEKE